MIQDHEFAEAAAQWRSARELSSELIELALQREADDNVSVVAMQVFRPSPGVAQEGAGILSRLRAIGFRAARCL